MPIFAARQFRIFKKLNMRVLNKNKAYLAPQSELIVIQIESNFMGDSSRSFSASFGFENNRNSVEEGGDI